tara:strand:- start:801 stop:1112 length:312 start_codon:yes stop_codon:yes gene_type:complete
MNTKEKVKYWLTKYEHLRDDDNRLCSNIWNQELKKYIKSDDNSNVKDFLRLYSLGMLTAAPTIKRVRAKLQQDNPELRGKKYIIRKNKIQNEWRKDLGYEVNK